MPIELPYSRKGRRKLFAVYIVLMALIVWFFAYYFLNDLRGGNATATISEIRSPVNYTVTFVTADGIQCKASGKWPPRREVITPGDTVDIHHPRKWPCSNLRHANDFVPLIGYFIIPTLLAAGLIWMVLLHRKEPAMFD